MAKIKLKSYQIRMSRKIDEAMSQNKIQLIEAPTGTGKTFMLIHKAKELVLHHKKVIISTFTNQLARDISDKLNVSITAGLRNYFDVSKLDNVINYDNCGNNISIDSIADFVKQCKTNNDYLIDNFLDSFDIDDIDKPIVSDLIRNQEPQSYTHDDNAEIIVTNHSYLLAKMMFNERNHVENNLLDKRYLFIDEVNKLSDTVNMLTEHIYSVYTVKKATKHLINDIKQHAYRGSKTDIKILKSNLTACEYLMNTVKNSTNAEETCKMIFNKIKNVKVKRIRENTFSPYCSIIEREQNELSHFHSAQNSPFKFVQLSKVRKYPSLKLAENKSSSIFLKHFLWQNVTSGCVGVSATPGPIGLSSSKIYHMLGIDKNYLPLYQISATKELKAMRKAVKIYLPDEQAPIPSVNHHVNSDWVHYVTCSVLDTFDNKNTLVIVGSYDEVDKISKAIAEQDKSINVIQSKRGVPTNITLKQFKNEGGILVGTRVYKDGMDLPGKQLERLYIAKIPFAVIGSPKYIELKIYNKTLANITMWKDTQMALLQAMGRLIRSPKERGNIYLLDSRIYPHNRLSTIKAICNRYGTIQKEVIKYQKKILKEAI